MGKGMKWQPLSLKTRIVLITIVLLMVSSWIFAWQLLTNTGRQVMDQAFANALNSHQLLIESVNAYTQGLARVREAEGTVSFGQLYQGEESNYELPGFVSLQEIVKFAETYKIDNGSFQILDSSGRLIFSSMSEQTEAGVGLNSLQAEETQVVLRELGEKTLIYVSAYTQFMPNNLCRVDMAMDVTAITAAMEKSVLRATVILTVISVALMVVMYAIMGRTLKPLLNLGWQAQAMAKGKYEQRAGIEKMDEIGALATEFNTMADAVEKHTAELKDMVKRRELFAANLSHEIKTPITSIVGYAHLATSMALDPSLSQDSRKIRQLVEMLEFIKREGRRLDGLSETLLLWSELQTQNEIVRCQLRSVTALTHVEHILQPLLDERKQNLSIQNKVDHIYVDEYLFISLIVNLCKNAVKASSAGDVISIEMEAVESETLRVSVSDAGIGMAQEEIHRVTEPFYMVDKARDRRNGGAGMGLTLCQSIVTAHEGTMEIESVKGQGTTIRLLLPKAICTGINQPGGNGEVEEHDEA